MAYCSSEEETVELTKDYRETYGYPQKLRK
jgi:hypothetical protein